jgi:hypothetical protein
MCNRWSRKRTLSVAARTRKAQHQQRAPGTAADVAPEHLRPWCEQKPAKQVRNSACRQVSVVKVNDDKTAS